jgi:hypothetical protein
LDDKLNRDEIDETFIAKLGLTINYVETLEDAEKMFEEDKESIGLILSEIDCKSVVTAGFLRRVLKFNAYHRVEIPIIF